MPMLQSRKPGMGRPIPPPLKVGDTLLLVPVDVYDPPMWWEPKSRRVAEVTHVSVDPARFPALEWLGLGVREIDPETGDEAGSDIWLLVDVTRLAGALFPAPRRGDTA